MKQKIIRYFNQGAVTYDSVASVQEYAAQKLASCFKDMVPQQVLEVGCGTGLFSQYMVHQFPTAIFHLTDIAPEMVAACQQRFIKNNNITISCVDAEALQDKNSYDLITSNFVMHWFDDIKQGIENLTIKLSTHGKLIFSILGDNSFPEWKVICHNNDIPVTTRQFPNITKLQEQFPQLQVHQETYQVVYKNAYDFLRTLKLLGGRASDRRQITTSIKKLRKIFQEHSDCFTVSYEIIYGICER